MKSPLKASVVRVHIFPALPRKMLARISAGRTEAARVWMRCRDLHHEARQAQGAWPNRETLQAVTKGQFGLHSQSIQMVCHAFLANIETTSALRSQGRTEMRYPYKDKRYYPLLWPKQAVSETANNIILPMGRGRPSLVLPKPEGFVPGGCKLVWNGSANELHVTIEVSAQAASTGTARATVDLGQIHQCAVTTDTGAALIVSGRGQRSLKRRMNQMHGQIARLQSRCKRGSRRWKKLARARHKHAGRIERQTRDLAHKGTRAVADFCAAMNVADVFIGDPHGVRRQRRGRHHNQRMAQWEYGRDKQYLSQKLGREGISSFTGSERGTSSRCPRCGHKHKPSGRQWHCKACGFTGHRDLVGSVNMHEDNFEKLSMFPSLRDTTYLRPGTVKVHIAGMNNPQCGSSSRPGTGHGEGASPMGPVLLQEPMRNTAPASDAQTSTPGAPSGAGHSQRSPSEAHPL